MNEKKINRVFYISSISSLFLTTPFKYSTLSFLNVCLGSGTNTFLEITIFFQLKNFFLSSDRILITK